MWPELLPPLDPQAVGKRPNSTSAATSRADSLRHTIKFFFLKNYDFRNTRFAPSSNKIWRKFSNRPFFIFHLLSIFFMFYTLFSGGKFCEFLPQDKINQSIMSLFNKRRMLTLSCAILTLRQKTGCSAFVKVEFILSHDVSLSEQPTVFLIVLNLLSSECSSMLARLAREISVERGKHHTQLELNSKRDTSHTMKVRVHVKLMFPEDGSCLSK